MLWKSSHCSSSTTRPWDLTLLCPRRSGFRAGIVNYSSKHRAASADSAKLYGAALRAQTPGKWVNLSCSTQGFECFWSALVNEVSVQQESLGTLLQDLLGRRARFSLFFCGSANLKCRNRQSLLLINKPQMLQGNSEGPPRGVLQGEGSKKPWKPYRSKNNIPSLGSYQGDDPKGLLPFHQQLCPASWHRHFCKRTPPRQRWIINQHRCTPKEPRGTLCALPRDKGYQRKAIAENRVLSYCKLLKQDPDTDRRGDCPQPRTSASTLLQGRESSPPGKALPTARTSRRSSDGFPAGDLSYARSHSSASGAAPRKGAGSCWGVRRRTARLPGNARPRRERSAWRRLPLLEVHGLVPPQVTSGFKVVGALP